MDRDIFDIIASRQSCRSYSGQRIEKEKLLRILEAGRLSPSARNSQPWSIFAAYTEDAVSKVGECTRANGKNIFTDKCSAFIVIVEEENEAAFGNVPHRYFAEMDIGMCVMNMVLEAGSLGVSSCILGAFDESGVKACCNISERKNVKLIIALGYAEEGYPIREKARRSFDETIKII